MNEPFAPDRGVFLCSIVLALELLRACFVVV